MRSKQLRILSMCFLIALMLINAPSTRAQGTIVTDFESIVTGGNDTTYLDLVRKVFPDAQVNSSDGAIAHKTIPLGHLFGDYSVAVFEEKLKINSVETPTEQIPNNGPFLVLIHLSSDQGGLSTWDESSILALFELKPSLRLLDAVDVQADKFTGFWEDPAVLKISPQTDAVIISNSHFNSSQSYQRLTIVAPLKDRLQEVFDLPVLLSSNDCGNNIIQTPKLSVIKRTTPGYFNISVHVKLVKNPDDASCEKRTKGYTRNYTATLVWNASKRKYESRGAALDQLAKFNKARF